MAEGAEGLLMRLGNGGGLGHLTYCTNIHPGETWDEVSANLADHLPSIKAEIAPHEPLGLGLRLSAEAANGLSAPGAMERFKSFLDDGDYYVFTFNGFPYGTFHGKRVKENAYRPDWSELQRLDYTNGLADLMADLLPDDLAGSISTVPGTFKPWAEGRTEAIAANLIAHVGHLVDIENRTGRAISLAIEPEPYCLLETIEETIAFFERHLFTARAIGALQSISGLSAAAAEQAMRDHIGVCYDVCHAAVEFEDPRQSIADLRSAGIQIGKVQLSDALRIANVSKDAVDQLAPFDEPVYLHQVVQSKSGRLTRFVDLPEALDAVADAEGSEWRVHFHVPIFLAEMKDFSTTQAFLGDILALQREDPISAHLEVETYTWDVLPEQYRNVSVSSAISRELAWVVDQLTR